MENIIWSLNGVLQVAQSVKHLLAAGLVSSLGQVLDLSDNGIHLDYQISQSINLLSEVDLFRGLRYIG
jgi:hypothetical protein